MMKTSSNQQQQQQEQQQQPKEGATPSVVDAFISALFASNPSNDDDSKLNEKTKDIPNNNNNSFDTKPINTEERLKVDYQYAAANNNQQIPTKRERSITEEVEAYDQLRKKISIGKNQDHHIREIGDNNNNINNNHDDDDDVRPSHSNNTARVLVLEPVDWNHMIAECRMLVRHVPSQVTNRDLYDHFIRYGTIMEVVIKNSRGFVHFKQLEACQNAVKFENGKSFKGHILELEVCRQKPHIARGKREGPRDTSYQQKYRFNQHGQRMEMNQTNKQLLSTTTTTTTTGKVHLIVWDQPIYDYANNIKRLFEEASIDMDISAMKNRSIINYSQLLSIKAKQGVKVLLEMDPSHETKQTIDLHILDQGQDSVRFERYDSISLSDAIKLTKKALNSNNDTSSPPPPSSSSSISPILSHPPLVLPPSQQQQHNIQHHGIGDLTNTLQLLDTDTLAAIYDLVHVHLEAAIQSITNSNSHPSLYSNQQSLYPTYPQQQQPVYSPSLPHSSNINHFIQSTPTSSIPSSSISTQQLYTILSSLNK